MRLKNRTDAGRRLASRLENYGGAEDLAVLGLPRGGVPVASEIAGQLEAPLDAFVVRKVGVPGHEELAMGAVASGDVTIRNEGVLERLDMSESVFQEVAEAQREEVRRRERLYREKHPGLQLQGRTVILTDDGLATGATMRAAVEAVRKIGPRRLVVAVPIAARQTADDFRRFLQGTDEEFVCLYEAETLDGIGRWYDDFAQVTDDEVRTLLGRAGQPPAEWCNSLTGHPDSLASTPAADGLGKPPGAHLLPLL